MTLPVSQYDFVKKHRLHLSWLLQDKINEIMQEKLSGTLDFLSEQEILSDNEYKRIVKKYQEKMEQDTENLTEHQLKQMIKELRTTRTMLKKHIDMINDYIRYYKIQLGETESTNDDSYKFSYKNKMK